MSRAASRRLGRLRRLGAAGLLRESVHRLFTRLPVERLRGGWAPPVYALSFWLTERCNLSCEMCWVETKGTRPTMTPDDWLRLADDVRRYRPRITVTGGEPTVYRGWLEVLAGIKARGLYLSLNTNGLGLASQAEALVRIGVDDVSVSLDGLPETHDTVRGKAGAYTRSTEGLEALLRARGGRAWPIVRATTVLSNENLAELETLHDELGRLGVDCHTLQHRWFVTPKGLAAHAEEAGRRLGLGTEALGGFLWSNPEPVAGLAEVAARLGSRRGGPAIAWSPALSAQEAEAYYRTPEAAVRGFCRSRWYRMSILSDGTATPCLGLVAGSVRERPFAEIWNGPEMRRFRGELTANGLFPGCVRCCGLFSDAPAARAD